MNIQNIQIPGEIPGNEKQEDPKITPEQKEKYYKLHKNNAELGTEVKESESPETMKLKKIKDNENKSVDKVNKIEKVESTDPAI